MSIQEKELTFQGKVAGSVTENPNIAYFNGVEFTQSQYDQIYGSELLVTETDELSFEFPLPQDVQIGLQYVQIYFKAKVDSGEVELRSADYGVYNNNTTTYQQKFVQVSNNQVEDNIVKFNMKSTGNYGTYEVKVVVTYDDAGLNSYSGNYTYQPTGGTDTTITINRKKLDEIITELEGLPVNTLTYVTFAQVGTESVDS